MSKALLLTVRFHDGRYHGARDWPPAPSRLFQALVAGAARGRLLTDEQKAAFLWLEQLGAPVISAPPMHSGRQVLTFVPNNDLDAVDGDPARTGQIRTAKTARPRLFDARRGFFYGWTFEVDAAADRHAEVICAAAHELYRLGRGVDGAWSCGEVIPVDELERRLVAGGAPLHRPAEGGAGNVLLCPAPGSFESLEARFEATLGRFTALRKGKRTEILFAQPPKPRFRAVAYDSPSRLLCFDLQRPEGDGQLMAWPLAGVGYLVEAIRTAAADRLRRAMPDNGALIERVLVGRGAGQADKAVRIRIVPLPSIGHVHADRRIRRIVVEVPANCPLEADDVAWSCSGLGLSTLGSGEVTHVMVGGTGGTMLEHFGIGSGCGGRVWRTVTPAALPQDAARRRIAPERRRTAEEAKGGAERMREERRAIQAVVVALRHAGIAGAPTSILVQREPFASHGLRAEAFAGGTRFAKEVLWHVEVAFDGYVAGPVSVGDGRYLGLGLMAPKRVPGPPVLAFRIVADPPLVADNRLPFLQAVRRALMALSRDNKGEVPRMFSGHEADGGPAASGRHEHLFLGSVNIDGAGHVGGLVVAAPWAGDRSVPAERRDEAMFARVVGRLKQVRAGSLGLVELAPVDAPARLLGPHCIWHSSTPYRPTRHAQRGKSPADAVIADVIAECHRRLLPRPEVEIDALDFGKNGGHVEARLTLRFATAVDGPLMLGRDSHLGGGLFEIPD